MGGMNGSPVPVFVHHSSISARGCFQSCLMGETSGSLLRRLQINLRKFRSGFHNIMRNYFGRHRLPPIYDDWDL